MPEVRISPATLADLPAMIEIDHSYVTDYVWQMEVQQPEEGQYHIGFRQVRLPRSARVEYPRFPGSLADDWSRRSGLLVARLESGLAGYISLKDDLAPQATWVTDLVVVRRLRRQGIGSALVLAAQEWAREKGSLRLVLEMQPKNYPAICLAQKLGFDLCGYNDRYYTNQDIALFFAKSVR